MVFLQVSREILVRRLLTRPHHFFPEKLLASQLNTMEPPTPGEQRVHTVLAEHDSETTAAQIIAMLWPQGEPSPGGTSVPAPRESP
jgi:gluconokinase